MTKLRAFLLSAAVLVGVLFAAEYIQDFGREPEVALTQPSELNAAHDEDLDDGEEGEHIAKPAEVDATTASAKPIAPPIAKDDPRVVANLSEPKEITRALKPVRRHSHEPSTHPAHVKLIIRDIEFSGVTAFPAQKLKNEVKSFIGKELTVQEAFDIPAAISNYYTQHNLVARANLVGALNGDGLLRVSVIETDMKQAQVDKALSTLAPTAAPVPMSPPVAAIVQALTPTPAVADALASLAASNPTPANTAAATYSSTAAASPPAAPVAATTVAEATPPTPAVAPVAVSAKSAKPETKNPNPADGETDYILKRYANRSRQYEVFVDNYGIESTGSNRIGASMRAPDTLSENDELYLLGVKSSGSEYGVLGYRWQTGLEGLSLGVKLSKLSYDVVSNVQSAILLSGDAVKKGVELAYELVKAPDHVSVLSMNFDSKHMQNTANNAAYSSDYTTQVSSIEWKGVSRELEPGGAVLNYDSIFAHGQVDLSASPNYAADALGAHTDGSFSKFRFDTSILQPLSGLTSLFAGLSLQRSNQYLESSERFYAGGPLGVRAYGWGDGVGSAGELLKLELRQKLDGQTTLTGFYDWGQVRKMVATNNVEVANVDSVMLKGYGMSLGYEIDRHTTLRGTWARRQGNSPDPLNPSPNPDGEYDRNRFWLSMETRF